MNYSQFDTDIVYCDDAFSSEELLKIRTIGDNLESQGHVDLTTGDGVSRKAWVTGIYPSSTTSFIYTKMCNIAKSINSQFFNLDIEGFLDSGFWYTTYSAPSDRLDWHADKTTAYMSKPQNIKMSIVLQLSEPTEYEGGLVEAMTDDGIKTINKKSGLIYAIPGYLVHRVTPITSGQRRVLVSWFTGPKFK